MLKVGVQDVKLLIQGMVVLSSIGILSGCLSDRETRPGHYYYPGDYYYTAGYIPEDYYYPSTGQYYPNVRSYGSPFNYYDPDYFGDCTHDRVDHYQRTWSGWWRGGMGWHGGGAGWYAGRHC